jgi:hypothetical protein
MVKNSSSPGHATAENNQFDQGGAESIHAQPFV